MKECLGCGTCFPDSFNNCPKDGEPLRLTLRGDHVLDGRYKLESRLGRGGMGIVFKASHVFLKSAHAVKVILPDLVGDDPMFVTRFRQEAILAASIRHKNLVQVTDFGVTNAGVPFLVMELLIGQSLLDLLIKHRRLSPKVSLEIMEAVAAGVGAAHGRGIVHRDLKPLNIFLQDGMPISEGLKILDFGLAKIKSAELLGSFIQAKTNSPMGSPLYMAPEQWSDGEPDGRADIYSMGIMLYQLLAGEPPFNSTSMPKVMRGHLMSPPPSFANLGVRVSPSVENAVRHALEKEPEDRPSSVEEFIAELREAVGAQESEVTLALTGDLGIVTLPRPRPGEATTEAAGSISDQKDRFSPETQREIEDEAEQLQRELEDAQRRADEARRRMEEAAQRRAEEEAERRRAEAEAARKKAEEEAALERAKEQERKRAEQENSRKLAAEAEARRLADEELQRVAEEERARRIAIEEANRLSAEVQDARRRAEEARKRAEVEAQGRAKEEAARKIAEERAARLEQEVETAQQRAEQARLRFEEEAQRRADEENTRRNGEEDKARKRAQDDALRLVAEEAARLLAKEETDRLGREVEEAQRRAEEARLRAEEEQQKRIEEETARRRAEEEAKRLLIEIGEARKRIEEERHKLALEAEQKRLDENSALVRAQEIAAREVIDQQLQRQAEEDERNRSIEEAEHRRFKEEELRRLAENHALQLAKEAAARESAEAEAHRLGLEIKEARRHAEEAQRKVEEETLRRSQEEGLRRSDEEAERVRAKEDAERLARLFEATRRRADKARIQAEEEVRKRSEEETARKAAEEKANSLEREVEEAQRRAELARLRVEEEVRKHGLAEEARRREEDSIRAAEREQRRQLQEQIQLLEDEKSRREREIVTAEFSAQTLAEAFRYDALRETAAFPSLAIGAAGTVERGQSLVQETQVSGRVPDSTDPGLVGQVGGAAVRTGRTARRILLWGGLAILLLGLTGYGIRHLYRRVQPVRKTAENIKAPRPDNDSVSIPGGTFMMGRNEVSEQDYQWPAHPVTVQTFFMDRTEVTNSEYAEFVRQSGYQAPKSWSGTSPPPGRERWPATDVSVDDARAFAAWRSTRDGVKYRLPTEEEWEYAARGGSKNYLYPWGNSWYEDHANLGTGAGGKVDSPKAVGSYPQGASACGVLDMIGNVWEWTSSEASLYPGNASAFPESKRGQFVMRGGSHQSLESDAIRFRKSREFPATFRQWFPRDTRSNTLGFRLVYTAGNSPR